MLADISEAPEDDWDKEKSLLTVEYGGNGGEDALRRHSSPEFLRKKSLPLAISHAVTNGASTESLNDRKNNNNNKGKNNNNNNDRKKKETKTRKYSLNFLAGRRNTKEDITNELIVDPKQQRSLSSIEPARQKQQQQQQQIDLEYDYDTMRKKSCIALTNHQVQANVEEGDQEAIDKCTSLVKAIEIAAFEINEKEAKTKKRKQSKHAMNLQNNEMDVQSTLNECKTSEIMVSNLNRSDGRRSGIAERSEIERKLVKQSVKYLIQDEFITWCQD